MRTKIKFVKEVVVYYLWMISQKKFCLDALGSSSPKCVRAFLFYSDGRKLAFPENKGGVKLLLNRVRPSKDLTTYTSRNLYIRIHHLMQMVSESLLNGGRGRLALLTCLPAVSLLSKWVL